VIGPAPIALLGLTGAEFITAAEHVLPSGASIASELDGRVFRRGRFAPEYFPLSAASLVAWRTRFAIGLLTVKRVASICTAGHAADLATLAALGWKRLNRSISLNAPDNARRDRLMPVSRRTPIAELQRLLVAHTRRRNFTLGVNDCLIPGCNDDEADAERVANFCRPLGRVLVKLIPYNPGSTPLTQAPSEDKVVRFIGWLRAAGLPVRRRVTKGRSIMAACGQLGTVALRRRARADSEGVPA